MRNLIRKAISVVAVAAITIALTAVPAFAVGPFTGHNTQPVLSMNPVTGVGMVCPVSTVSGMTGSGPSGPIPDTFSTVTFSGCAAVGIASATVTVTGLPWSFNPISYNPSTGVISGTLTGVALTITINAGPPCTMTLGGPGSGPGTINATFGYSTGLLDLGSGGNLTVQTVAGGGCAGLANVGDPITLGTQYQIDSWTVTPGGAITGNNSQVLRALNLHDGVSVICSSSTVSGTLQSGSGLSGANIASLTSVIASGCSAIGIAPATITPTNLPWSFNAVSYDGVTGVTTGTLTGVQATAVIHTTPACTVTVGAPGSGGATINGTFTNSTDVLDVTGSNVTVQSAVGQNNACAGLAHVGDAITLAGQYQFTSDQTITRP